MNFDLASLGLTKEDLQDRVVDAIAEHLRLDSFTDDDGNLCGRPRQQLDDRIKKIIDDALLKFCETTLTPSVVGSMAAMVIPQTNNYGQAKGPSLTLVEYVAKAADAYLHEQVNHEGKGKGSDSYNWSASGSRAFWLLNRAVQENVHAQINQALATVNAEVASAVSVAVKSQIEKIQTAFIVKR